MWQPKAGSAYRKKFMRTKPKIKNKI